MEDKEEKKEEEERKKKRRRKKKKRRRKNMAFFAAMHRGDCWLQNHKISVHLFPLGVSVHTVIQ